MSPWSNCFWNIPWFIMSICSAGEMSGRRKRSEKRVVWETNERNRDLRVDMANTSVDRMGAVRDLEVRDVRGEVRRSGVFSSPGRLPEGEILSCRNLPPGVYDPNSVA